MVDAQSIIKSINPLTLSQGAKKLMNGLDLTNFSKLRKAGPTTVTPETIKKKPDPKKKAATFGLISKTSPLQASGKERYDLRFVWAT